MPYPPWVGRRRTGPVPGSQLARPHINAPESHPPRAWPKPPAPVRPRLGCGVSDQGLRRRPAVGVWAALAGVATVSGAVLVVVAVVATRRLWFGGYISEAGTAS